MNRILGGFTPSHNLMLLTHCQAERETPSKSVTETKSAYERVNQLPSCLLAGYLQSPDIAGPGTTWRPKTRAKRDLRTANEHPQAFVGIYTWALVPIWRIPNTEDWLEPHSYQVGREGPLDGSAFGRKKSHDVFLLTKRTCRE